MDPSWLHVDVVLLEGGSNQVPIAAIWNVTKRTVGPLAAPPGAANTYLQGVSCSSATVCTAVGAWFNNLGAVAPLAETWSGEKWTTDTVVNPKGITEGELDSVSCTPLATACTASGEGGGKTLVERHS